MSGIIVNNVSVSLEGIFAEIERIKSELSNLQTLAASIKIPPPGGGGGGGGGAAGGTAATAAAMTAATGGGLPSSLPPPQKLKELTWRKELAIISNMNQLIGIVNRLTFDNPIVNEATRGAGYALQMASLVHMSKLNAMYGTWGNILTSIEVVGFVFSVINWIGDMMREAQAIPPNRKFRQYSRFRQDTPGGDVTFYD